jgi:type VI secretion system protein ImpL
MAILDTLKRARQSPIVLVGAAGAAVVALCTILVRLGLIRALVRSPWLWEVVTVLAALLTIFIIVWGIPWWRERSFVHRLGSDYRIAGEESPQEFQSKFTHALRRFRSLPQQSGKGEPLYSLPWFLMVGPGGAGKSEALRASGLFSALTPPPQAEGGTQNCDWWVSNTMLVLDTAGRYAIPIDLARDRAEWYRLLRLVRHYHGREPLNGMIVTMSANELALQPHEKLRADGGLIRERIEEAIQELGVDFPVYVLVTKGDQLEGFSEFFGVLPQRIAAEAVGFVDDSPAGAGSGLPRGTEAAQRIRTGIHSIYERFHVLRLSILDGNTTEHLRQPIFCFPEEFKALERPLNAFIGPLLSEDVRYHTTLFRGVFFSSARREGTPISSMRRMVQIAEAPAALEGKPQQPYFLHDLFETILPRDRALSATVRPIRPPR